MTAEIKNELSRLEQQHDIKILLAVESGSRAWGFASTDSDWDVRYIYIHKLDWYLTIDSKKDSQEEILPNEIEKSPAPFSEIKSADAGMVKESNHVPGAIYNGE